MQKGAAERILVFSSVKTPVAARSGMVCQAVDVTQRTCGSPMVERKKVMRPRGGCREARELPATVCSTETGQRTHSNNTRDCVAAQQDRFVRVTRNELKPHNRSRTKDGKIKPSGGWNRRQTDSQQLLGFNIGDSVDAKAAGKAGSNGFAKDGGTTANPCVFLTGFCHTRHTNDAARV